MRGQVDTTDSPAALVFPGPGGAPGRGRGAGRGVKRGAGVGMSTGNYRRAFNLAAAEARDAGRLRHLELHGPHDLRATFATWLEDAGIPSRVIDELMGHESGRPERGVSRMGALYRETTPAMLARVAAAIDERLSIAEASAIRLLPEVREWRTVRRRGGRRGSRLVELNLREPTIPASGAYVH